MRATTYLALLGTLACLAGCSPSQAPVPEATRERSPAAPTVEAPATPRTPVTQAPAVKDVVGQVRIVNSRLVPFTTAQGESAKMVLVTWHNEGPRPIYTLRARIDLFDASGRRTNESASSMVIWVAEDHDNRPLKAGQTYKEKGDEGYVVLESDGEVVRTEVTALSADDQPAPVR